jgi:hypothetical protein
MTFLYSARVLERYQLLAQRARALADSAFIRLDANESWPDTPLDRKAARAILAQIYAIESQQREWERILMKTGTESFPQRSLSIGTTGDDPSRIRDEPAKIETIRTDLQAAFGRKSESEHDNRKSPLSPLPPKDHLIALMYDFELRAKLVRAEYDRLKDFFSPNPTIAQIFMQEMNAFRADFAATRSSWTMAMGYQHYVPDSSIISQFLQEHDQAEAAAIYPAVEEAVSGLIDEALKPALKSAYRGIRRRL